MARRGWFVRIAFSLGGGGTALACVCPRVCVRVCVCAVLADHGARGTSCGARVRFVDRVYGSSRMHLARFPSVSPSLRASMAAIRLVVASKKAKVVRAPHGPRRERSRLGGSKLRTMYLRGLLSLGELVV